VPGTPAPRRSLAPAERETVILMDDYCNVARVSTHQRRVITRLERNPLAVKVESLSYGTTAGAIFELPSWAVSFRAKPRRATSGSGRGFPGAAPAVDAAADAKDAA
jgi:hypothetical protein